MFASNRFPFRDVLTGLILVCLLLLGAFAYMSRERTVYAWDEANYTGLTADAYEAFFPAKPDPPSDTFRPVYGLRRVHGSFHEEYNWLFTVPMVFVQRAFGASRTAYVMGLTFFYYAPYCLIWGMVATLVFRLPTRTAFWGTVGLILALPLTYFPVFRSFPDVGGAALLGLATILYLRDIEMKSWRSVVVIGLILCLMPLFRRHFMYGLTTFFAAAILQHFCILVGLLARQPHEGGQYFIKMAPRFITLGASILFFWFVFARPFVQVLLSNNYFHLYAGFMIAPREVFLGIVSAYGVVLFVTAILGYIIGWRMEVFRSAGGAFMALTLLIALLQWVFVVRQPGAHYLYHFHIFLLFGLLALLAGAAKVWQGTPRLLAFVAVGAILIYRLLVCFGLSPAFDSPHPDGLIMARTPPKVRKDYDTVKNMITALREAGVEDPNVYVAGCSWTLNYDTIKNGEIDMFGRENVRLHVPPQPAIDSRDWLPLDVLLKSQLAVAAWPVQYGVTPPEQQIIALTAEAFQNNLPIAQDFERLPGTYPLENGATATLFRRIRASSRATALQELAREQATLTPLPGRQKPWVSLDGDSRWELMDDVKPSLRLTLREDGVRPAYLSVEQARRRSLAYVADASAGAGSVLNVPPQGRLTANVILGGRWNRQKTVVRCVWADAKTGKDCSDATSVFLEDRMPLALSLPPYPKTLGAQPYLLLEFTLPPEGGSGLRDGALILERVQFQ